MSNTGETGAFLNNSPGNNSNASFWATHRKIIIIALVVLVVVAAVIGTVVAVTLPKEDTGLASEVPAEEKNNSKAQTSDLASEAPPQEIPNSNAETTGVSVGPPVAPPEEPTERPTSDVQIPAVNCPESEDFIKTSNSQCFRYFKGFTDSVNWNGAKTRCKKEGMAIAKPLDDITVELSQLLKDAMCPDHDCGRAVWLGGRGSGNSFGWIRDRSELSNESPLWASGQPYSKKKDRCLGLWQGETQPYKSPPCTMTNWVLCEVIA